MKGSMPEKNYHLLKSPKGYKGEVFYGDKIIQHIFQLMMRWLYHLLTIFVLFLGTWIGIVCGLLVLAIVYLVYILIIMDFEKTSKEVGINIFKPCICYNILYTCLNYNPVQNIELIIWLTIFNNMYSQSDFLYHMQPSLQQ